MIEDNKTNGLEEYLKKEPFKAIVIIFVVAFAFMLGTIIIFQDSDFLADYLRIIVLLIGVIGGGYGILIAIDRQKTFSAQIDNQIEQAKIANKQQKAFTKQVEEQVKQTEISQKQQENFAQQVANTKQQLFNESFERGVTLLAHENLTMRSAGIRVLWELGKNSNQKQAKLILQIVHDFVRQRAMIQNISVIHREKRLDIELGIYALSEFIERAEMNGYKIPFKDLDLRGLRFDNLKLQRAYFEGAKLHNITFFRGKLHEANFERAELNDAKFWDVELNDANFCEADMSYAFFADGYILSQAQFKDVIFQKGRPILNSPTDKDTGEEIVIPDNRAYTWKKNENKGDKLCKKFIMPYNEEDQEAWSGKWVDDVIRRY